MPTRYELSVSKVTVVLTHLDSALQIAGPNGKDENRENKIPASCPLTEAPLLRLLDHQIVMLPILSLETCLAPLFLILKGSPGMASEPMGLVSSTSINLFI